MSGRVAGKTALVTGAGQGLGAETARVLAREGAQVLLTDINADAAAEVAAAINREHGRPVAHSRRHDVASERDWEDAVAFARESMGSLSVLVNNAGIVSVGTIEDLSLAEWRRSMDINVDGVFLGIRACLPLMREAQPASIITISSISGLIAAPNFAAYNATKAAVWMLSKSVALHCAKQKWDIRANTIHPAFVRTQILHELAPGKDDDWLDQRLGGQVPIGRLGEATDVAHAVVYLASDESRFMTGAEIKLDGGISAM